MQRSNRLREFRKKIDIFTLLNVLRFVFGPFGLTELVVGDDELGMESNFALFLWFLLPSPTVAVHKALFC